MGRIISITVMTYNIRSAMGNDGRVDLGRIAGVIKEVEPDLVALQEVDQFWRRSGKVDQARELARMLHMHHRFGPALVRGRARFGNAVLSRLEELSYHHHSLPSNRENRGMLEMYFDFDGRLICMAALHLGLTQAERSMHLNYILNRLTLIDIPLLVAGDFNMTPANLEMKRIRSVLQDCCDAVQSELYTYPSTNPTQRIDYIFHSPDWQTREVTTIPSQASDHLPLVARLALRRE
ncbi:MAG: endonuclease [Syntrophomonadaceae bacterium]|nr:endonuclease [Syntrophomonadaceae bacterium]